MKVINTYLCRYDMNGVKLGLIEPLYECEGGVWVYYGLELIPWQLERIKRYNGISVNGAGLHIDTTKTFLVNKIQGRK